ncbi:MAG: hypothetical protein EKK41_29410 [Hyphomicrobiales bacterium]|nr:MAG: hypothetical protein EKK41_29410 [Hyphomicrobiales bacterium]
MISVQSAMLVALGFLVASLLGLLIGSALWARAVRLTTWRIKQSLPVSEAEIKADRDRLRAEFAVRVHKLETALEQAKLERARQFIEINRRDASITALESTATELKSELDEHVNARRVLEQTVADRLPRVEARLAEAKRLLFNRDREIAELTSGAKRHKLALEEASVLTQQQSQQIENLTSALQGKAKSDGDARFEGELVLRTEVETLRARTREQAALIERLQQRLGQNFGADAAVADGEASAALQAQEIERLKRKLADAEGSLAAVRAATNEGDAARIAFESEVRDLKSSVEDQQAEIARLRAALETFDRFEGKPTLVRESKLVLKARLGSAQAHSDQQAATIGRLRTELAASHERLARQAAHFMEELRRISQTGYAGVAQPLRRRSPRLGGEKLAERVAEVPAAGEPITERAGNVQDLAKEIRRAQALVGNGERYGGLTVEETPEPTLEVTRDVANGNGVHPRLIEPEAATDSTQRIRAADAEEPVTAAEMPQPPSILEERRRPRLLDRLSGLAKG